VPDLLAALERILARVETLNLFTERREEAKVVEQARAAINIMCAIHPLMKMQVNVTD